MVHISKSPPLPFIFPPCPLSSISLLLALYLPTLQPTTLSPSHGHCTVPVSCLSCCPGTPHPFLESPIPYANGYKEHLIILVNRICPPLFPPWGFSHKRCLTFPFCVLLFHQRSQPLCPQPTPDSLFTQLGQISHPGDSRPHTPSPSSPSLAPALKNL